MFSSSDWLQVRLGDLVEIRHGWPFKGELMSARLSGLPIVVNIGNFQYSGGFRFESTTAREYRGKYPPEYELSPGDILLVMTCQTQGGEILGVPAKVPADGRTYLHNQRLGKVVIRERARIHPNFLYWLFLWSEFNRDLFVTASGTKILHTAPVRIEAFKFLLPPLPEQVIIAEILDVLSDKIDLNRRMNETLEATARAIFRSWFVDSTEQAHSREWRQGRLEEVADNPRRGVVPAEMQPETPYIGLEHMPRKSIALDQWGSSEDLASGKFSFFRQEILFGKLRPYFHKVGVAPVDGVCSTDILVLVAKREIYFGLLLGYVSSEEFVSYTDRSSAGTRMPRTNWADMGRYEITIPPDPVALAYSDLVRPMVERIIANIHESRTLATLRDTLLPKLLSGEIRVKQAEKMVGEAV